MWAIALKFLGKYWKIVAFVAVVGILLGVIHFKDAKIDSQASNISTLEIELAVTKRELTECQGQIDNQNKAIDAAAEEANKKKEAIDKLTDDITKLKKTQKAELQELRNKPAPKSCEETKKYLQDGLGELKW